MHVRAIIYDWEKVGGLVNIAFFYALIITPVKKEAERSNLIDDPWIGVQQQSRNGAGSFKENNLVHDVVMQVKSGCQDKEQEVSL